MNEFVNETITGNFYFSKRMLGGFNIMVEITCQVLDPQGDLSPEITRFKKATEKEVAELFYKN